MTNQVTILDIKQAMKDCRFRDSLPADFKEDIEKYLENPSCGTCNVPLYKKIIEKCKKQIQQYYPGKTIIEPNEEQINMWSVINCHINDLEKNLKKLPMGKKQLAIARFEDQVTVVINEFI